VNEKDYAKSECGHTVWRRIFLSIAGIGALIAVGMAWLPLRVGLSHFVIEDMHYYMTTARNVVQGQGVTLDGKHPTNGFHPLWMLICGLVHLAVGSRDVLAMHLVLTVCAGFLIATGYVIYRCMDRRAGPILATAFVAWFLCNYRIMAASLGGLETALNGLCISLMAVYLILSGGIDTWRKSVVLGLLLGLAYWSRMDAFLLGGVVLVWVTFSAGWAHIPAQFLRAFLAGAISVITLIPWFVFSLIHSGTWLPNSARAINAWAVPTPDPESGALTVIQRLVKSRVDNLVDPANDIGNLLGIWPFVPNPESPILALGATVLFVGVCFFVGLIWKVRRAPAMKDLWWIPVYAGVHIGFYISFGQPDIRCLYPAFIPLLIFGAAAVRVSCEQQPQRELCFRKALLTLFIFILSGGIAGVFAFQKGFATCRYHSLHAGLYDLARCIEKHSPPDAVIGSFNAGIISYYSHRPTVNLDGVMNDSVIPAIVEKRLAEYLDREKIGYLADMRGEIEKFMTGFGGDPDWTSKWQVVYEIKCPWGGGIGTVPMVIMQRHKQDFMENRL